MKIEDLKCCGNCKHRYSFPSSTQGDFYVEEYCGLDQEKTMSSDRKCKDWKFYKEEKEEK